MIVALASPPPSHIVCKPVTSTALLERVQERRHQAGARSTEWVTESDRSTVDVHVLLEPLVVDPQLLLPREDHAGEGLVDLDEVDVAQRSRPVRSKTFRSRGSDRSAS